MCYVPSLDILVYRFDRSCGHLSVHTWLSIVLTQYVYGLLGICRITVGQRYAVALDIQMSRHSGPHVQYALALKHHANATNVWN